VRRARSWRRRRAADPTLAARRRVSVVGVLANTCIESTSRFAMELGYHVTLVRDASAPTRAR
jgi:nicotinamidase-related amidase